MDKDQTLEVITRHYLESGDFNGYLVKQISNDSVGLQNILIDLIESGFIVLNFGDRHPNPYILAFEPEPKEEQINKLKASDLDHVCAYPTKKQLNGIVDRSRYEGQPFTLQLALGEPQLKYLSFELSVLEWYRNDPRYMYENSDTGGYISMRDEPYLSPKTRDSDRVVLQSYGFSYTDDLKRAVAVFLRYLSDLTPEHQQVWNARLIVGEDYWLHPEYFRSTILGEWMENVPIFDAFVEELYHINQMCARIGWKPLFLNDFKNSKPTGFEFLIRPTLTEFNSFVHLLDKMMSDNLNKRFFENDLSLEREETRRDGKVMVIPKGTIHLLEEWFDLKFRTPDRQPLQEMIGAFKKVRQLRQKPAHSVQENIFDQTYFQQQRELIMEAYGAVRTIRLCFANHPQARDYQVPEWLYESRILTY